MRLVTNIIENLLQVQTDKPKYTGQQIFWDLVDIFLFFITPSKNLILYFLKYIP